MIDTKLNENNDISYVELSDYILEAFCTQGMLSSMFIAKLKQNKTESTQPEKLIIKSKPKDQFVLELYTNNKLYEREQFIYELLTQNNLKHQSQPHFKIPNYYKTKTNNKGDINDEIENIIILEYLQNYTPYTLENPINFNEASLILQCLANFHSTYNTNNTNKTYNLHKESLTLNKKEFVKLVFDMGLTDLENRLKSLNSEDEFIDKDHLDKLKSKRDFIINCEFNNLNSKLNNLSNLSNCSNLVSLVHGDFWSPNVMKNKFDTDIKSSQQDMFCLIDFQWTRLDCCLIDVYSFLYTSINSELVKNQIEDLFSVYIKQRELNDNKKFEITEDAKKYCIANTIVIIIAGGVDTWFKTEELKRRAINSLNILIDLL